MLTDTFQKPWLDVTLAASGPLGTAPATVNLFSNFAVTTTTPGVVVTLPNPTTEPNRADIVEIFNAGTELFWVNVVPHPGMPTRATTADLKTWVTQVPVLPQTYAAFEFLPGTGWVRNSAGLPTVGDCISEISVVVGGAASSFTQFNTVIVLKADGTPYPNQTWRLKSTQPGSGAVPGGLTIGQYAETLNGPPQTNATYQFTLEYVGPPSGAAGFGGITANFRAGFASTGIWNIRVAYANGYVLHQFPATFPSANPATVPFTPSASFTCAAIPFVRVTKAIVRAHTAGAITFSAAGAIINGWTVATDTAGAFNNATGLFTAPRTGFYRVTAGYLIGATNMPAGKRCGLFVSVNNASFGGANAPVWSYLAQAGNPSGFVIDGTVIVSATAGNTIGVKGILDTATTVTGQSDGNFNYLNIEEL